MSYCAEKLSTWSHRKEDCVAPIFSLSPTVLGLQLRMCPEPLMKVATALNAAGSKDPFQDQSFQTMEWDTFSGVSELLGKASELRTMVISIPSF